LIGLVRHQQRGSEEDIVSGLAIQCPNYLNKVVPFGELERNIFTGRNAFIKALVAAFEKVLGND
jgi:hypothetical protein